MATSTASQDSSTEIKKVESVRYTSVRGPQRPQDRAQTQPKAQDSGTPIKVTDKTAGLVFAANPLLNKNRQKQNDNKLPKVQEAHDNTKTVPDSSKQETNVPLIKRDPLVAKDNIKENPENHDVNQSEPVNTTSSINTLRDKTGGTDDDPSNTDRPPGGHSRTSELDHLYTVSKAGEEAVKRRKHVSLKTVAEDMLTTEGRDLVRSKSGS